MGESTNVSYRYAVQPDQGVGFIENTGDDWVRPQSKTESVTVFDDNGLPHTLVIDNSDGLLYDISGREGPSGTEVSKVYKDKVLTDGTSGTDIEGVLIFPEDSGTYEHYYLESLESHIYVRPYSETDGYPSGLKFNMEAYEDGEPTTYTARAEDVPKSGDISYDRQIDANRIYHKLKTNMGQHLVLGVQHYYKAQDFAMSDADTTTENTYQETYADPIMWIHPYLDTSYDRAIGTPTGGTDGAAATGPDSSSNARAFTGTQAPTAVMTGSLAGDFSIQFWVVDITAPCTIFTTSVGSLTVSITESGGVYTLSFADGTSTITQNLNWANASGEWVLLQIQRSGSNLIVREGYEA